MGVRPYKNPGAALLRSLIFPGGEQIYKGHAGKGILALLTRWTEVLIGICLFASNDATPLSSSEYGKRLPACLS